MTQGNSILISDDLRMTAIRPNGSDVRFRKSGPPVPLSDGKPSFSEAILDVVELRSKKEVRRLYASTVIALMENLHSWRDGSESEFIRNLMGTSRSFFPRTDADDSIPMTTHRGSPQPTIGSFTDFLPKPFFKRCFHA
jgi:hypothetical protein